MVIPASVHFYFVRHIAELLRSVTVNIDTSIKLRHVRGVVVIGEYLVVLAHVAELLLHRPLVHRQACCTCNRDLMHTTTEMTSSFYPPLYINNLVVSRNAVHQLHSMHTVPETTSLFYSPLSIYKQPCRFQKFSKTSALDAYHDRNDKLIYPLSI